MKPVKAKGLHEVSPTKDISQMADNYTEICINIQHGNSMKVDSY